MDDSAKAKQQQRRFLDEDTSILDVVGEDARSLRRRLAQTDQQKLDQYLTSIREVERKLIRQAEWLDIRKPRVKDDVIRGGDDDDTIVDLQYPYNTSVMYDLMVLALQTNSTNVICFGHPGEIVCFLKASHLLPLTQRQRPELLKELSIIERFYAKELHFSAN